MILVVGKFVCFLMVLILVVMIDSFKELNEVKMFFISLLNLMLVSLVLLMWVILFLIVWRLLMLFLIVGFSVVLILFEYRIVKNR